jgi:cytidylate kinase
VSQAASRVAAIPEVRQALLDFQRAFARRAGGAVDCNGECHGLPFRDRTLCLADQGARLKHRLTCARGQGITLA